MPDTMLNSTAMPPTVQPPTIDLSELVLLAAEDSDVYAHEFFPKTARNRSPDFHRDIWEAVENPADRYINVQVFRGGSKTTLLRLITSKRIAYGISRTILYIGKSEGHATRSLSWLKRQVDYNRKWANTFGLSRGSKWSEDTIEVLSTTAGELDPVTGEREVVHIWITAVGITGSVRGINFDDYRPDLIVIDDVIDDENAGTQEQRQKIEKLLLGAVRQSLAPAGESAEATYVMLQTPLNKEDASCKCLKDPTFKNLVFSCFDEAGNSRWPDRYPTEHLLADKASYAARNQLSIWMREMECKLTDPESSAFMGAWLQFYDQEPQGGVTVLIIDPVPPPSERELAVGLKRKDFEAFGVVRRVADKYYVLEISANRGHDPSWTIAEFFRLCIKWNVREVAVEAVAYQRTLAWLLRQAMSVRKQFYTVVEVTDKRKKYDRIVDSLNGIASNRKLFVRPGMTSFIEQFTNYPDVAHDDELEVVAVGCARLAGALGVGAGGLDEEADDDFIEAEERDIPALNGWRGAP